MLLLISYDLKEPGRNYEALYDEIKKAGTWWHHLDSTWIIQTEFTPKQWYQRLTPHLDRNDTILIIQVSKNPYGRLPKRAWDWLARRDY